MSAACHLTNCVGGSSFNATASRVISGQCSLTKVRRAASSVPCHSEKSLGTNLIWISVAPPLAAVRARAFLSLPIAAAASRAASSSAAKSRQFIFSSLIARCRSRSDRRARSSARLSAARRNATATGSLWRFRRGGFVGLVGVFFDVIVQFPRFATHPRRPPRALRLALDQLLKIALSV